MSMDRTPVITCMPCVVCIAVKSTLLCLRGHVDVCLRLHPPQIEVGLDSMPFGLCP